MKIRKIRKKETKRRNPRSLESFMLQFGKRGDTFYTKKDDKFMTALAIYAKRKIKTERMVAVNLKAKAEAIIKITLL